MVDLNSKEKDPIVAPWMVPSDCDNQLTPDDKTLLVGSNSLNPPFVLVWTIPAQLKDSKPVVKEQMQPTQRITGGPLSVSPDGKCFFCTQGARFGSVASGGRSATDNRRRVPRSSGPLESGGETALFSRDPQESTAGRG